MSKLNALKEVWALEECGGWKKVFSRSIFFAILLDEIVFFFFLGNGVSLTIYSSIIKSVDHLLFAHISESIIFM